MRDYWTSPIMRQVELRFGKTIPVLLDQLFNVEHRRVVEVLTLLGISRGTLVEWAERNGYAIDTSPRLIKKEQVPA